MKKPKLSNIRTFKRNIDIKDVSVLQPFLELVREVMEDSVPWDWRYASPVDVSVSKTKVAVKCDKNFHKILDKKLQECIL